MRPDHHDDRGCDESVRIDVYLLHGQEAAVLAILTSGYRTLGRFGENALGQTAFTLESGVDPTPASALRGPRCQRPRQLRQSSQRRIAAKSSY